MTLKLATIPGDGTGPEVVEQALAVLGAVAKADHFDVSIKEFNFGAKRYLDSGKVLDDDDLSALKKFDAIFLGAVGHPDVKPGILEKGLLLKLRFDFDQYINLRPVKLHTGIETPLKNKGPKDIDMVVVRENTEDLYCGHGGIMRQDTPHEVATQTMIATRHGVERCVRFAFDLARDRKKQGYPGKLTLVHKTNVLTFAADTWKRTFDQISKEFSDIETDYHHVDACCMYMVSKPETYDVIVTPNMFGDIITDLGAAIAGGMGIASSGNLNPRWDGNGSKNGGGPSMFEPVHGSSPDIAGQDKANPLAAIDTMSLLLGEIGKIKNDPAMSQGASRISAALQKVIPRFEGLRLDRSGYGTKEIGKMVIDAL